MNKEQLVNAIAERAGLTKKDANAALEAFVNVVESAVANGDKVQLVGFGSFEARQRSARRGRNPQTGAELEIPATTVPAFKPGHTFKDMVKD